MMFEILYQGLVCKSMIDSRWLYKIRHETDDSIGKYKVVFVAKWFSQKESHLLPMILLSMANSAQNFPLKY